MAIQHIKRHTKMMNNSMDQAFDRLKKGKGFCWKTKNRNEAEGWVKAFYQRAYTFGPSIIITENYSEGYHYVEVNRKTIPRLHSMVTTVPEEIARKNYHTLCHDDPVATAFVRELYNAGLIPGIRSIVQVEVKNENPKKGVSQKKTESDFGTKPVQTDNLECEKSS